MFSGSITALLTPFKEGKVDGAAFEKFVTWQVNEGTHGVVVGGTTGESPTLTKDEVTELTTLALKVAKDKIPVIVGTGTNSTTSTIEKTIHAHKMGAQGALIVVPYYNKPTQEGLFQHYKAIHDATDIPIILYDVPGRCGTGFTYDTILRLAELPRILGIKDATGNLVTTLKLSKAVKESFALLTGEDALAAPFLFNGGHGNISVTSNIAPKLCSALQNAWRNGDLKTVQHISSLLQPLNADLFCESNPIPVKYAASCMGLMSGEMRLPMVPPSASNQKIIRESLVNLGLLAV